MHYFGIHRHTHSMLTLGLSELVWEFQFKIVFNECCLHALFGVVFIQSEAEPSALHSKRVVGSSAHSPAAILNPLDTSAPTVKRGKERETPKAKKPSALKKVILKEREERKRLR